MNRPSAGRKGNEMSKCEHGIESVGSSTYCNDCAIEELQVERHKLKEEIRRLYMHLEKVVDGFNVEIIQLKAENKNKVIIFVGNRYGIIDVAECMALLNVKVKDFGDIETRRREILNRYGICSD